VATISKFYLHDAATPNTGTMPGSGNAFVQSNDTTGDATGARTARAADATIGTAQTSSLITSTANTTAQKWGHRRFVSAPLAAHTFAVADGSWTFSYARAESNTNHNGQILATISSWRPSTGAFVIFPMVSFSGTAMASTSEATDSVTGFANSTFSTQDGDILVIEVYDSFTQGMSTAYTSTFYYDGTTEASATSCASFVTPPAALTLYAGPAPQPLPAMIGQAVQRAATRCWRRRESGIVVPRLWTPADGTA
jgi:hypothetical protein